MSPLYKKDFKPTELLLVEDDDIDAEGIYRAFKKAKIANPIIRAVDGVEALEILESRHKLKISSPYILLVDLNMPRMGGIELVQHLRSHPTLSKTVVFVTTTSKQDEDIANAYDLNVAGYIVKESAGNDFADLAKMLDCYWHIVELPA